MVEYFAEWLDATVAASTRGPCYLDRKNNIRLNPNVTEDGRGASQSLDERSLLSRSGNYYPTSQYEGLALESEVHVAIQPCGGFCLDNDSEFGLG